MIVTHFLPNCSITEITNQSYSTDLTSANFFPFPELKTALRERRCQDIKKNLTTRFNVVPLVTFHECFVKVLERHKTCIAVKGDYWEGK
jgi:hypothetical protein